MKYNVAIKGTGSYLPLQKVSNEILTKHYCKDTSPEWIVNKLGIHSRRIVNGELPSDMGYYAAQRALNSAYMGKEDVDMILVSVSSQEMISPSTACIIHNKLQIEKNIPCLDINAVCSGFIYAMTLASSLIQSGTYRNILIIATEAYSAITDWKSRDCVFFGDGAGAIILGKSESGWMISNLHSNGSGTGMTGFTLPLNDTFKINGKQVFEKATQVLPPSIAEVLSEAKVSIDDIKILIPHQPSINILKSLAQQINLPFEKVKLIMGEYANLASASIPVALDECVKLNEIQRGDLLLFTAIGSGWTWGSMVMRYE